jgi:hypothetical protein
MTEGKAILTSVLATLDAWGGGLIKNEYWAKPGLSASYTWPAQMQEHGVPYEPAVFATHALDACERQRYHRALLHLEAAGLIVRVAAGRGTACTHVRLTPLGVCRAIELVRGAGEEPDVRALRRALHATLWSGRQHLAAVPARKAKHGK